MIRPMIAEINHSLKRTKRAIISLGCSFVQGQGAIHQSIFDEFSWTGLTTGYPAVTWDVSQEDTARLMEKFPDISVNAGDRKHTINFSIHETNNSFVYQLANKYFDKSYTPVNLGRAGCGNRAAIKDLYFYPDINWHEMEEIIVIYCPSGAERFDFINDTSCTVNDHHNRWKCIWPNDTSQQERDLSVGYLETLYSTKFQVMEQITHMQELLLWCKYMKAKLIVTPAFQEVYNRDKFIKFLKTDISRDESGRQVENEKTYPNSEYNGDRERLIQKNKDIITLVDMWPWDKMFYPDGHVNWARLCMTQENDDTYFYSYYGKGSPGRWITPCAHPGAKAHDLFAKLLHQHIERM